MFNLKIIVDEIIILQKIICREYKYDDVKKINKNILDKFPDIFYFLCNKNLVLTKDFFNIFKHIEKIIEYIQKSKLINESNKYVMLNIFITKEIDSYIPLQNKLWNKYRYTYIFLQKCYDENLNVMKTVKNITKMIKYVIKNKSFLKIIKDVKKYKNKILLEWNTKKNKIIKIIEDITKIKLNGKYIMIAASEKIYNGMNLSYFLNKNIFIYGHKDEWNNYNMCYIIHEILHSMFGHTDVEHSIIELIADNELRIQLNGCGKYFEINDSSNISHVGHSHLREMEQKIYPHWIKYLKNNKNIFEFRDEMIMSFNSMKPKKIIDYQSGGVIKKPLILKKLEYNDNILYYINNKDTEQLDEFSEFRIGSLTKIFTSVLLLILQQNKLVDIYDNVTKYISSDNNDYNNITILDIMNHKAGLKGHPDESKIKYIKFKNASEVFNVIDEEKIIMGTKGNYLYSNTGYIILGKIIEVITSVDYIDALKKYILDPLELNHTNIGNTNIKLYDDDGNLLNEHDLLEIYFACSAGGLYSCINDLISFGKNFINLLNNETIEILKKLYFFYERETEFGIAHQGGISGGLSKMKIKYDKDLKFKFIQIELQTCVMA